MVDIGQIWSGLVSTSQLPVESNNTVVTIISKNWLLTNIHGTKLVKYCYMSIIERWCIYSFKISVFSIMF